MSPFQKFESTSFKITQMDSSDLITMLIESKKVEEAVKCLPKRELAYLDLSIRVVSGVPKVGLQLIFDENDASKNAEIGVEIGRRRSDERRTIWVATKTELFVKTEQLLKCVSALFVARREPIVRLKEVREDAHEVARIVPRHVSELHVRGSYVHDWSVVNVLIEGKVVSEKLRITPTALNQGCDLGGEKVLRAPRIVLEHGDFLNAGTLHRLDCEEAVIRNHGMRSTEINRFLRMWMEGSGMERKMRLELETPECYALSNEQRTREVLEGLPTRAFQPESREAHFKMSDGRFMDMTEGRDIVRADGRVASVLITWHDFKRTVHIVFWGADDDIALETILRRVEKKVWKMSPRELMSIWVDGHRGFQGTLLKV